MGLKIISLISGFPFLPGPLERSSTVLLLLLSFYFLFMFFFLASNPSGDVVLWYHYITGLLRFWAGAPKGTMICRLTTPDLEGLPDGSKGGGGGIGGGGGGGGGGRGGGRG